ncbi:sulfur carrier protein ThiS [Halalkalibacter akibai]|uniref:Sulfur carrier protein ThiS n=1 Tax=Halalkalibacter akibai (strain ATCC 43226 / DSM 21942 / CIP 109018 / JCM 9157 / 1139) TaxID=1236973 RepID=W4QMZ4_HALA3|nr:sulfur carrier protein ThiS [Halalkalibacter akibai]GAE33470.1 sulfur carrier protein ThiS [Halalkalibacter akibai JCM 9157]
MRLIINGEEHLISVTNLADVVAHFELEPHLVVTEVDGTIIERSNWEQTNLTDGMKIELVQFVGGG